MFLALLRFTDSYLCVCLCMYVCLRRLERERESEKKKKVWYYYPACHHLPGSQMGSAGPYLDMFMCVFWHLKIDENTDGWTQAFTMSICAPSHEVGWHAKTHTHTHTQAASAAVMRHLYPLVTVLPDLLSLVFGLQWFIFLFAAQVNTRLAAHCAWARPRNRTWSVVYKGLTHCLCWLVIKNPPKRGWVENSSWLSLARKKPLFFRSETEGVGAKAASVAPVKVAPSRVSRGEKPSKLAQVVVYIQLKAGRRKKNSIKKAQCPSPRNPIASHQSLNLCRGNAIVIMCLLKLGQGFI